MGIDIGQEIHFRQRGVTEFSAVIALVEPFERPGERLNKNEDIRYGFLLHFTGGHKCEI